MYRQILITPSHRRFQQILWRSSPDEEIKTYDLNTVTYGVNCAPYLALRVLQCISEEDCSECPYVREALVYCTYVDDICVGGDTIDEAVNLQDELINVLRRSGMELKKWASNLNDIVAKVPPEDRICDLLSFDESSRNETKVLGLQWSPRDDIFTYRFRPEQLVNTKRGMLSLIARMFDPLGLLSPVILFAKQLLQRIWHAGLPWDEQLPPDIADPWRQFVEDLPALQYMSNPRYIGTQRGIQCLLCGFCDASTIGYAAVVYVRFIDSSGNPSVSLLGAKTKTAPLKPSTIPRFELCAALLLARWMSRIKDTLSVKLQITDVCAWSDSATVLSWLKTPHDLFKIFVSNRVFKIRSLLPNCHWNHITSADNPADCSSRGLMPSGLVRHDLYLNGPKMLFLSTKDWNTDGPCVPLEQLPEAKVGNPVVMAVQETEPEWYERFSSYVQAVRITARMLRFIARCRGKPGKNEFLSRIELDHAALLIARSSQRISFSSLIQELSQARAVSSRLLAKLRPFIDTENTVRVGGRLSRSQLPDDQKHPVLLSKSSHFSLLIIRHWYEITGHSGPQLVTSLVGRQYWILSVRTLIRTVISRCTTCVRITAENPQPLMADLPSSRVTECHPFMKVGVDYAGPFSIKENRL